MKIKQQAKIGKTSENKLDKQGTPINKHQIKQDQPHNSHRHHKVQPHVRKSPSNNRFNYATYHTRPSDIIDNQSHSTSNLSRPRNTESLVMVDRVVQLHERLKNMNHFYKSRIDEEKKRTGQRNQVFLGIIEEMQHRHNQKVVALKKMIEEVEGERKDVGLVDERMNQIKGSIDEILKQSADLKLANECLQRQINEKEHNLREKQQELGTLKGELMQSRNELEGFERLNLRQHKRMIDKTYAAQKYKQQE